MPAQSKREIHGSFIYSKTASYDSEMVATCPLQVPMILLFLWVNPLEKQPGDLLAAAAAAAAKSLQSCPTLCNSIDGSPPGSPVPGILQARTPEWVAISFSNA